MDLWYFFAFLALWFFLQLWLLPRLGISTCCCAVPAERKRSDVDRPPLDSKNPVSGAE